MQLVDILDLEAHGPDVWVGVGPEYPWGGLYGGQIVAQALVAAGHSVGGHDDTGGSMGRGSPRLHSTRAYFIRSGDPHQPVRYEVERIRNGRSFATRRVVARQDGGAILNLEASFQRVEASPDIETIALEVDLPRPEELDIDSWSPAFSRASVPGIADRQGSGRATAWMKASDELPDDLSVHFAGFAFLSDDLPTDAVVRAHDVGTEPDAARYESLFTASLDHTIWFHRPGRVDRWHLQDFSCHSFVGGRGLALGHIHSISGEHIATVAQEVLLRDQRNL